MSLVRRHFSERFVQAPQSAVWQIQHQSAVDSAVAVVVETVVSVVSVAVVVAVAVATVDVAVAVAVVERRTRVRERRLGSRYGSRGKIVRSIE